MVRDPEPNEYTSVYYGRLAFEAYAATTGNRSLVSGERLPSWNDLGSGVQEAWIAAAEAIRARIVRAINDR